MISKRSLFASIVTFVLASVLAGPAAAGEWLSLSPMETGRSHLGAVAVNNEIFAAGGSGLLGPITAFEVYDVAFDYWRALPAMPSPREQFSMTAVGGEIFIIGGFGEDGRSAPSDTVWAFTVAISAWRSGPEMPIALARHGAVEIDGSIYVFGGVGEDGSASDRVLRLLSGGRGWEILPTAMPEALADAAVAVLDGKIYITGGRRTSGEVTSRVDVYDPNAGTWTRAADMPAPRAEHTAGAVNGRIHVAGGVAANVFRTYQDHFAFDPTSSHWSRIQGLTTPRHSLASVVVQERWYVVGGGAGAGLFTEFTQADVLEVYEPAASE